MPELFHFISFALFYFGAWFATLAKRVLPQVEWQTGNRIVTSGTVSLVVRLSTQLKTILVRIKERIYYGE